MSALHPPAPVVDIASRLERAGHEAWCVGGAIRDALLGEPHLDWDLATSATPAEVQRLFKRTVPVGIEFGTVGVLDASGTMHEVTTFRRDVTTDGRHAVVEFGASLDEDLARRDFTINAIAYSPSTGELRDPFGGRRDLAAQLVRAVGIPAARLNEDRLRALRGIRFASRFGFAIEPATWRAIADCAPHLGRLSAERVKQEIEKTMDQVPRPSEAFRLWRASGAFGSLVPELASVTDATLASIDCLARPGVRTRPQRRVLRIASLFADLAPDVVGRVMRELRFSNSEGAWVTALVRGVAQAPRAIGRSAHAPTDGELRRWIAAVGRMHALGVVRIVAARSPETPASVWRETYRRTARIAYRDAIEIGDLAVNGEALQAAGVPPGREMGRILKALIERVRDDQSLNDGETLLRLARELHGDEGAGA